MKDSVTFIRPREYKFIRDLRSGACGRTVLLYDDIIEENIVCKKFDPRSEVDGNKLFQYFKKEVKILYQLNHPNVVRVFNYYLYPEQEAGYILMEFVEGTEIDDYVSNNPEKINELFLQAIEGFRYLESKQILHRDIRLTNLMVQEGGGLKIIDFGFGKVVQHTEDFDKSISLNHWCDLPQEFYDNIYDFRTEVYFIGKLFEMLIMDNGIESFKHFSVLNEMCKQDPSKRLGTFEDVATKIKSDQFSEMEFTHSERKAYQDFSEEVAEHITKIEQSSKFVSDIRTIITKMVTVHKSVMLEEDVPNASVVFRCLIHGEYYYKRNGFSVRTLRNFLQLIQACSEDKSRIILANLHSRLNAIERYSQVIDDDDIPF